MSAERRAMPERRPSLSEKFEHDGLAYDLTIGFYDRTFRRPGELFLTCGKSGSGAETNARDGAIAISIALQFGVAPELLAHAMTRNADGSPSGPLGAALEILIALTNRDPDETKPRFVESAE